MCQADRDPTLRGVSIRAARHGPAGLTPDIGMQIAPLDDIPPYNQDHDIAVGRLCPPGECEQAGRDCRGACAWCWRHWSRRGLARSQEESVKGHVDAHPRPSHTAARTAAAAAIARSTAHIRPAPTDPPEGSAEALIA